MREELSRVLKESTPTSRTSINGLLGILKRGQMASVNELGKTGMTFATAYASKYLRLREEKESQYFGKTNCVYGYFAPKDELLSADNPDDIKKALTSFSGGLNIVKDAIDHPDKYVISYVRSKDATGKPNSPFQWNSLYRLVPKKDALSAAKWFGTDKSKPGDQKGESATLRFYPITTKDGKLNTDLVAQIFNSNPDNPYNMITQYGDVAIQYKSSILKDSTVTGSDSLDTSMLRSGIPLPAKLAVDGDKRCPMNGWGTIKDGKAYIGEGWYNELQIWKPPTVKDIAKVIFTGEVPPKNVTDQLAAAKIPYEVKHQEPMSNYEMKPSELLKTYGGKK